MPRPGRPPLRLEPLEARDTPALIGLEVADQVVAASAAAEQNARVAVRPDGTGFVVVYDAPDGGGETEGNPDRGVFVRRYDADWNPVGGPVQVNTYTAQTQNLPAVGVDAAGNFVVAWQSFLQVSGTSLYDVYARRFDFNGTPLDAAEFLVNTASAADGNTQRGPAVGVNDAGRFVVAWWGGAVFTENVFAKGYTAVTGGLTEAFAETRVNTPGPADHINPAVAVTASGAFVVAYQGYSRDGGVTQRHGDYGVYLRRMNANGTAAGPELRANAVVNGDQQNPDVAADAAGNFVVAWDSPNVDGSASAVVTQRYAADGSALGANATVNATTAGAQRAPRVARTGGGEYVVVWEGDAGGGADVYYRKFAASGAALTAETVVNAATAGDGTAQTRPDVGVNAAGDFVVPFTTAGASADAVLRRVAEAPVVTFSDAGGSAPEATTDRPFAVTRSGARYVLATTTAVTVARTGGTATAVEDYSTALPLTLTFGPAVASLPGTLTVVDDNRFEPDETLTLGLAASQLHTVGAIGSRAVGIVNDDVGIGLTVAPAAVSEDGGAELVFTFTRVGPAAGALTVPFAVGGSAAFGSEYTASGAATFTATTGSVALGPGETVRDVRVTPVGNPTPQPDHTVTLTVTPGAGYEPTGTGAATGSILDDDMGISVAASPAAAGENAGTDLVYTFTRTFGTGNARTVNVAVSGTATFGAASDYTVTGADAFAATAATITFPVGATQVLVRVRPRADGVFEPAETVTLRVAPGPGYMVLAPDTATTTVQETDPPPTLSVADAGASEADGFVTFTVTLTGATAFATTVAYATTADTAAAAAGGPGTPDFTARSGTLNFPASAAAAQSLTVVVALTDDAVYEAAEAFFLDLSAPTNATISRARGTATIADDEPPPTLAVGDVSVSEADGTATFTVTLTGATALPVSVGYATAAGTAVSAAGGPGTPDFAAATGSLNFPASAAATQTRTVVVTLTDDAVREAAEGFFLDLSAPTNATIGRARGAATVADDDAAPTLAVGDVSVSEADGTATFTVTLTGATALPVSVGYATAAGTAVSAAGGPGTPDFAAATGSLNFPASAAATQTRTVVVTLTDDAVREAAEAFFLDLSAPTNATIARARGGAAVADDDPLPAAALAVSGSPFAEANGVATVTVTLSNPSILPVTIDLGFGGTAPPAGYAASATRIVVAPGATTGSITLTGIPDDVPRADGTVVVTVSGVTNGTAGAPAAVTAVRADATPPAAADDAYATVANTPLVVAAPGLLSNDTIAPGSLVLSPGPGSGPTHGTLTRAADGGFTYAPEPGYAGPDSFRYAVRGPAGQLSNVATVALTVTAPPVAAVVRPALVVGGSPDGSARVFAPAGGRGFAASASAAVAPFGPLGVELRTAAADVDGDGLADLVLVTSPGTPIRVAVVSGADNRTVLVAPFDPFGGNFTGGGFVAAADLDGDGKAEFVVTPDQGGGPRVSAFSLAGGGAAAVRANFFGIDDAGFRGGARAALGDVNRDGRPDLAVSAGFLGGPRTALFDGATLLSTPTRLVGDFFAFPGTDATTLRNGVYVAVGDVDGDGFAELVFGGGPGGAPRVFVLSGAVVSAGNVAAAQANPVANFFVAGNSSDRSGVRVAVKPAAGGGVLVAGSGAGELGRARVYVVAPAGGEPAGADVYDLGGVLAAGVFVG